MIENIGNGRFMLGDCLERMAELLDASVDMILCDLPYGTTRNKWDEVIPFEPLWREYWRIAKPGAAVVLTAAQPFTSALGASQIEHLRYAWGWEKEPTGHLNAKRRPMLALEDVMVFCRVSPPYNPQNLRATLRKRTAAENQPGQNYGKVRKSGYDQTVTGYPTNILPFAKERSGFHPTQKPVALFEYLIRTYTHEGMTVLDNCAGSGTTAIAAERSGRRWICIEKDPEYFARATDRARREVGLFV